ncbi:Nn.00g069930.m01.CDS01 [Neocucurbitaria sp. VM-36]
MDGAPADSHSSGSQLHPQLRQRMLNRAATFAEGVQPSTSALPRRRSSLLSDLSDTRHSLRSSTDNLLRTGGNHEMEKLASSDEPSHWVLLPIVAAIVPAVVGLTHENGAAVATDMLMLALASWFLHWCVRVPWDWYHEAQQRRYEYAEAGDAQYDDTIFEEDEESVESPAEPSEPVAEQSQDSKAHSGGSSPPGDAQKDACEELKREELLAFACCFLGPLLGALLLHTIRGQLTRAEGIVSNFNLGIFFLGAEIRPFRRLIKMKRERLWHLQRVVRSDPKDELKPADAQQISQRLTELEARLDDPVANNDMDISKLSAEVRQSTQLQLDALNRAVRRYEKRHVAQSLQIEARFQDLESRLGDALALAAAAARTGQRPGFISMTISWVASIVDYVLRTTWDIAMYPLRTAAAAIAMVRSWFIKDEPRSRRRGKGQLNAHSSISTPRMQSKTGR